MLLNDVQGVVRSMIISTFSLCTISGTEDFRLYSILFLVIFWFSQVTILHMLLDAYGTFWSVYRPYDSCFINYYLPRPKLSYGPSSMLPFSSHKSSHLTYTFLHPFGWFSSTSHQKKDF